MAPREVYRYTDSIGDTVVYKFDPELINNPENSPVTIYHEWRQNFRSYYQLCSLLIEGDSAIKRYQVDKKPSVGMELYRESDKTGKLVVYMWEPFDVNKRGYAVYKEL